MFSEKAQYCLKKKKEAIRLNIFLLSNSLKTVLLFLLLPAARILRS